MLFFEMILSVSLTGTVPFCVYLLLRKKMETRVSASLRYGLLKLCLLCYFFPFALLKSLVMNVLDPSPTVLNEFVYLDNKIVLTDHGYVLNISGKFSKIFCGAWLCILLLLVSYQFFRYLRFRRQTFHQLEPDPAHQPIFDVQKKELGLRRQVSLLYCRESVSPYTFGIFRPCVVISAVVPESEVSMAIRHELQHIKSHDFLYRCIAFLAVLLHCWNPFLYAFWKEFCEIQEMACDERITAGCSPEEVRRYGYSLIHIAGAIRKDSPFPAQFAQKNRKSLSRRISLLGKRFERKSCAAGIFLTAAILVGASIPAAAYSPEIPCWKDHALSELSDTDWIYTELSTDDIPACPEDEQYFPYTDQSFTLEDGTILQNWLGAFPSYNEKSSCAHSWTEAVQKLHFADGEGGCRVLTYHVSLCSKCGFTKDEVPITSLHSYVCPHENAAGDLPAAKSNTPQQATGHQTCSAAELRGI